MENFTPLSAALGGGLIGVAAVLFMALHGRIAGISGIAAGVLAPAAGDWGWRIAFIAGLVAAPFAVWLVSGDLPPFEPVYPLWLTMLGGVLVGFGARLGGGCTSGHGVCGMARLSSRSIAATIVFMATAIVVTFAIRHSGAHP